VRGQLGGCTEHPLKRSSPDDQFLIDPAEDFTPCDATSRVGSPCFEEATSNFDPAEISRLKTLLESAITASSTPDPGYALLCVLASSHKPLNLAISVESKLFVAAATC
jgi:hypothetical protein